MSEDVMIPIADESDKQLQRCEEVIENYPGKKSITTLRQPFQADDPATACH
ncbi:hypothetical protein [Bifidobacterium magnum]|nr:hypothetical protein [Bifidobacterium magnum]